MKKLFFMLFSLFFVYILIQCVFTFFTKENVSNYIIRKDGMNFEISEEASFNDMNFYAFTVKANNTFKFQINHNFSKANKVITSIEHYKDDNYECILPIFKNGEILIDIICYTNNEYILYRNLKAKNNNLDKFVIDLESYKLAQFTDVLLDEEIEGITIYKNNLIKDHYIALNNYKGIYNISKNFNSVNYKITLYSKDVYNPKLSAFVDGYYVSVDYDRSYDFNKINVVNLMKLDTSKITSNRPISMDSYIQGVVDGKVYLYDKDNKVQYEIMPAKGTLATHTGSNMKYYDNGTWETLDTVKANDGVLFNYGKEENDLYDRFDKVGSDVGYYYMYKKNGDHYDVYRRSIKDDTSKIYLFSTKTINHICYVDNYVYYIDGDTMYVYNDEFGIKSILQYRELAFNTNLRFNVYVK